LDQEQGTIVDCVYCGLIKPELKGTKKCPKCGGVSSSFKPLRMMDKNTSERELLNQIFRIQMDQDGKIPTDELLNLLTRVGVYNFDFKSALINLIREIENE
jgi:hypothetical protein